MKNRLVATGLLVGLVGGGALGVALGVPGVSSAQTSPDTTVSAPVASSATPAPVDNSNKDAAHEAAETPEQEAAEAAGKAGGGPSGPHQANGKTETPLTGDELAKATAAAATAAPGSTVDRAETDADGDAFEVHVKNADGTQSTVKLNADFSVKTVEAGHAGGPGGHGRGGHGKGGPGQNDAQAPASATTPTTTA
jgi:uncharacterized membrane protein YkoI